MTSALLNASVFTSKTAFASRPVSNRAPAARAARSLQIRASVVGDGEKSGCFMKWCEVPAAEQLA